KLPAGNECQGAGAALAAVSLEIRKLRVLTPDPSRMRNDEKLSRPVGLDACGFGLLHVLYALHDARDLAHGVRVQIGEFSDVPADAYDLITKHMNFEFPQFLGFRVDQDRYADRFRGFATLKSEAGTSEIPFTQL